MWTLWSFGPNTWSSRNAAARLPSGPNASRASLSMEMLWQSASIWQGTHTPQLSEREPALTSTSAQTGIG